MKKSIQHTLLFALLVSVIGCTKGVDDPNFNVTISKNTFKVGEPITFSFTGNPDNITFYSGEAGFKYEYRNRISAVGKPNLQFTSLNDMGVKANIRLLISNQLSGAIDTNSVKNGNWNDITSKAVFSTGADNTPSGVIDLSDYAALGKPVNIAFKYTDVKSTTRQNRWVIRTFNVNNVLSDNTTYPLATLADATWTAVDFRDFTVTWTISSAQLLMSGGVANTPDNEDWVVSRGIDLNYVKRDVGVAIKTISSQLSQYQYTYAAVGTYKVTFDASNVHYNGSKEQLKTFDIIITP